jgi:hypothetical protein
METVPAMMTAMMTAMTAMPTMPTMTATTGRCEVWGDRYDTDGNGTGKSDESFAQHDCMSSLDHLPHGLTLLPAAYVGLNGAPLR